MAETITISNSYISYITNQPYQYPSNNTSTTHVTPNDGSLTAYNTGWHILPTMLWRHFCTPKAWHELNVNYEAYRVDGYSVSVFNMVPLTTQLAIQGNTIFTAFNNCIYAIGYQDKLYETEWHNWYFKAYNQENRNDFNLLYKEGLMQPYEGNTKYRFMLPIYIWQITNPRTNVLWEWNCNPYTGDNTIENNRSVDGVFPGLGYYPSGLVWDPLNRPDEIMELRPGKNAITFTWERHACDENKWFNIDQIASWFPYTASGPYHYGKERPGEFKLSGMMDPDLLGMQFSLNPPQNDWSIPNWADLPIVPMQWWWHEMQNSIAPVNITDGTISQQFLRHMNLFFNGTERECYMYGPTQSFIKMMPIIDSNNTNIECSAQVAIRTNLKLSVKKRRSAIYCPTWGPHPWRTIYSARSKDRNMFGTYVRYRTGGMRRTWQNLGDSSDPKTHPRRTPYIQTCVVPDGGGQGNTFTTTQAKRKLVPQETYVLPSAPPAYEEEEEMSNEIQDPVYPPVDQMKYRKR